MRPVCVLGMRRSRPPLTSWRACASRRARLMIVVVRVVCAAPRSPPHAYSTQLTSTTMCCTAPCACFPAGACVGDVRYTRAVRGRIRSGAAPRNRRRRAAGIAPRTVHARSPLARSRVIGISILSTRAVRVGRRGLDPRAARCESPPVVNELCVRSVADPVARIKYM